MFSNSFAISDITSDISVFRPYKLQYCYESLSFFEIYWQYSRSDIADAIACSKELEIQCYLIIVNLELDGKKNRIKSDSSYVVT